MQVTRDCDVRSAAAAGCNCHAVTVTVTVTVARTVKMLPPCPGPEVPERGNSYHEPVTPSPLHWQHRGPAGTA